MGNRPWAHLHLRVTFSSQDTFSPQLIFSLGNTSSPAPSPPRAHILPGHCPSSGTHFLLRGYLLSGPIISLNPPSPWPLFIPCDTFFPQPILSLGTSSPQTPSFLQPHLLLKEHLFPGPHPLAAPSLPQPLSILRNTYFPQAPSFPQAHRLSKKTFFPPFSPWPASIPETHLLLEERLFSRPTRFIDPISSLVIIIHPWGHTFSLGYLKTFF